MKTQGEFKYFINGKEVLYKDLQAMIRLDMTVSVDGLNVYYSSPEEKDKPERGTHSKLEDVTISPKKVKDRLILAEKFKKKALDEIYFKNPNFKKEQEDNKFSKLNHNEVREEFINRARTEKMNRLIEEELERQEEDDSKSTGDYLEIMMYDWINNLTEESKPSGISGIEDAAKITTKGKKENSGKLYYELSWEFIEEIAKRMANNKSEKYPLYNWKKNIDIEELKQAINRHHIEVMKGNYKDGDEVLGHIVSYACNSMMLWEQLNKK